VDADPAYTFPTRCAPAADPAYTFPTRCAPGGRVGPVDDHSRLLRELASVDSRQSDTKEAGA
jgi:hypothetical protein